MKAFKGEVFCPECGGNLALGYEKEIVEMESGKDYLKRTLFLTCGNQNCPLQNKRQPLPEA